MRLQSRRTKTQEKTAAGEPAEIDGNAALLSATSTVSADDGLNSITAETLAVENALSSTTFEVMIAVGTGADPSGVEGNAALFLGDSTAVGEDTYVIIDADTLTTNGFAGVVVDAWAVVA